MLCLLEVRWQIELFLVVMELLPGDELRTWDDWFEELSRLSSQQLPDLVEARLLSSASFAESESAEY